MKPLFTNHEFTKAKSNQTLSLSCYYCKNPFAATKSAILQALKPTTRRACKYCSPRCFGRSQSPLDPVDDQTVPCNHCGKKFLKLGTEIRRTRNNFCTQKCAAFFSNARRTSGCRVSKMERRIQNRLLACYPEISFSFNSASAIGLELDIHIPDLKLAFEINGICHYRPIYGMPKFANILKNAKAKRIRCKKKGIKLIPIDASQNLNQDSLRAAWQIVRKEIDARFVAPRT